MVMRRNMALLDDAIDASGGLARWSSLSRFTLHLSVGGTLFSSAGHAKEFKDVTAEGSTQAQSVRFIGMTGGEQSGSFAPDTITIESPEGEVLRSWRNPTLGFPAVDAHTLADELHLVFFCRRRHLELSDDSIPPRPSRCRGGGAVALARECRNLAAPAGAIPPHLVTLAPEQIFYFDENALQRRMDHDLFGMKVAHSSWAHDTFGGIVLPTLRRAQMLRPDGTVIAKPVLVDVEIFDAVFE